MRKYYTRPCNFYYGSYAKKIISKGKALPLAGNTNIAFDQIEVFERKSKKRTISKFYSINEINSLDKKIFFFIKSDLKKITSKRKNILNLDFKKTHIMGILNVTPDSFSDGGLFFNASDAIEQTELMKKNGASIIDVGGESTRPGSILVNEKDEWKRIEKIIIRLKKKFPKMILSLDTRKSYVMKKGLEKGVNIINDVSGFNFDKKSIGILKRYKNLPFVLHHMQGTPDTMQKNPKYDDALLDIFDFFEKKINFFIRNKIKKDSIIIDPGIGFGKNLKHNLRILSKLSTFHSLGCPILIGTSRKRFIEHIVTKLDTEDRTGGTLSSVLYGLLQGVQLFRVHNVKEIKQGILVFSKILNTK